MMVEKKQKKTSPKGRGDMKRMIVILIAMVEKLIREV